MRNQMKFDQGLDLSKYKTFKLLSSKGAELYTIMLYENHWKCSCTGFRFTKHCKHVKQIKEVLKEQYESWLIHENRCTIDEIVSSNDFDYIKDIMR